MADNKLRLLHQLESSDEARIHIAENTEVGGTTLSTPYTTTVRSIRKERLDHHQGDNVDGIVRQREIYIEPHPDDDTHEQYVITTEAPIIGETHVSSIEARDWFEGSPGNGQYAIDSIHFGEVELID